MAWAGFPKVSLGDLAGAVNKLQESVKSIEKNFDSALGLDQLQAGAADGQTATTTAAPSRSSGSSALEAWGWGSSAKLQTSSGGDEAQDAHKKPSPETKAVTNTKADKGAFSSMPDVNSGTGTPSVKAEIPSVSLEEKASSAAIPEAGVPGQSDVVGGGGDVPRSSDDTAKTSIETAAWGRPPVPEKHPVPRKDSEPPADFEPLSRLELSNVSGTPQVETSKGKHGMEAEGKGRQSAEGEQLPEQQASNGSEAADASEGGVDGPGGGASSIASGVNAPGDGVDASESDQARRDGVNALKDAVSAPGDSVNAPGDSADASSNRDSIDTRGQGVNAPEEGLNAPGEQVTLARIVAGVSASQPFVHGDATSQETEQRSPKMVIASAFPAAAAPQFKPHAEVDSVVDLTAASESESLEDTGKGLRAEIQPEGGSQKGAENTARQETESGDVGAAKSETETKTTGPQGTEAEQPEGPDRLNSGRSVEASVQEEEIGHRQTASKECLGQEQLAGASFGELVRDVGGMGVEGPVSGSCDGADAKELAKLREQLAAMEAAMMHAAKQAQTKANELAEMGTVNDNLRAELEEVKRKKADDSDLEALRAEYQHRLGTAERKVYALTKERDMLRRESSRKSDTSTLLKEKDEIIKQVMAEGEELSKKQAAVEGQMRKLRGNIRELEVERDRLLSRLQVEEAKTESIQKDKAKTERQLADAVERAQAELAAQKESYTAALQETKEALARAEAAADSTKRSELDKQVKEAAEREAELVRQLEEVREQMMRDAQAAAAREDRLRRDVRELEARCQDAEARHSELVARVPDSTRPLLRQIEALQEAASSRAEAWTAVERTLNARVQEAEVAAAGAQERERAAAERMTQAASRMAVMEAQVSMLRAEQAALQRSLEKERARASETRQELLALKEAAATHEGRASQLEDEMKELRAKHRKESQEAARKRESIEQELEALRMERDKLRVGQSALVHRALERTGGADAEVGSERKMSRRPSNASSAGSSMEEGYYLQASLQGAPFANSMEGGGSWGGSNRAGLVEQLEALLRKREGELASYTSRLASLESTRDALAEELVKTTQQTEELAKEAALLPSLCAELEALRRRHASALELMGERDEEVEELRADLQDHKSMYREQIDMLVKQIERQSTKGAS